MSICKECNGTGHDQAGRPIIKLESYMDKRNRKRVKHTTYKRGSGCLVCLGLGTVEEERA